MTIDALLRMQIEQIWGEGRVDLIDTVYADTIVDHMPIAGQPAGRDALKDVVRLFRAALPDLAMTLHGTVTCGDFGVDWWTLTGTHLGALGDIAPTGRSVSFSGIDMVRVADGRIGEVWHVEEMFQFHHQLGLRGEGVAVLEGLPPPTRSRIAADFDPGATARLPDLAALSERGRRNLALGRRHIEKLWALKQVELADELYRPDIVDRNPMAGQRPGIAGCVDLIGWLHGSVPDLRMSLERYVADDHHVVDFWTMRGTHDGLPMLGLPAKGRTFAFNGMDISHFDDDGRIDSVFHVEDFEGLSAQLV